MASNEAASRKAVAKLHGLLTKYLTFKLDKACDLLDALDSEDPDVIAKVEKVLNSVSPAELTLVAKFLKDNDMKFEVDQNEAFGKLEDTLDTYNFKNREAADKAATAQGKAARMPRVDVN